MRHTKIVATLGPATATDEKVRELYAAGVDVFRLNASHGTREERAAHAARVRAAGNAAILLDLQGPKIRLGKFDGGKALLETGAEFTITTEEVLGTPARASTVYTAFARDVKPGDPVLLADGALALRAVASDGVAVRCVVTAGGWISDKKGINLPGVTLSTPSVTEKDYADLEHGLELGVDLVALSFVRRAADVLELQRFLDQRGGNVPLVAKIEKPEGVAHLAAILEVADGVMVARGDLGVEMPLEQVPQIQKAIIDQARRKGRFVITATQMLESMMQSPVPTRAEVSDVANAIYDGTDAVMLSGETSAGKFPVEAARMMARVAEQADAALAARGYVPLDTGRKNYAAIIADAAVAAASEAGLKAIVVFTTSGSTARLISRLRPPVPVYAFTPDERVGRQLAVQFGVRAVHAPRVASMDEMLQQVDETAIREGLLTAGDCVAFVAGVPIGRPGTTNTLKLHRTGEFTGDVSLY